MAITYAFFKSSMHALVFYFLFTNFQNDFGFIFASKDIPLLHFLFAKLTLLDHVLKKLSFDIWPYPRVGRRGGGGGGGGGLEVGSAGKMFDTMLLHS